MDSTLVLFVSKASSNSNKLSILAKVRSLSRFCAEAGSLMIIYPLFPYNFSEVIERVCFCLYLLFLASEHSLSETIKSKLDPVTNPLLIGTFI